MLVRRTRPVRLECIARGYLFGPRGTSTRSGARSAAGRCRPGCARPSGCPSRSSRRRRRPRTATTCRSTDAEAAALVGRRRLRAAAATPRSRSTSAAPRTPRRCGLILADTKFEFGDRRRRAARHRRDADARLVALLAGRGVRASAASPPSFDKQYVRDYYLDDSAGTRSRRRRRCRADVIDGTRGALRRGLRAAHRRELRRLVRHRRATATTDAVRSTRACRVSQAHVDVTHLPGIARSAGRDGRAGAARRSATTNVRRCASARPSGSSSTRADEDAARAQVDEMCERLLAEPGDRGATRSSSPSSASSPSGAKVGVVLFPGTNCELDVQYAVEQLGGVRPRSCSTPTTTVDGVDAVVVPGGFAHGDYLRTGRDRPLLAGDGRRRRARARRRARSSGSATASRC